MSPNTCSSKTMTLEFRAREVGYRTKVSVAQHKQASVMKTAAQEFFFWITMKLDRGGCPVPTGLEAKGGCTGNGIGKLIRTRSQKELVHSAERWLRK